MAEKLVNTEISEYIEVLSSEAPAPGGGAAARIARARRRRPGAARSAWRGARRSSEAPRSPGT